MVGCCGGCAAPYLGDQMNLKIGVIYPILLEFLLRHVNHKPF